MRIRKVYLLPLFFLIIAVVLVINHYDTVHQEIKGNLMSFKYSGQVEFSDDKLYKELKKFEKVDFEDENKSWWYELVLTCKKEQRRYFFNQTDLLLDVNNNTFVKSTPYFKEILDNNLNVLERGKPYGVLLTWNQVTEIFPRMAKAKVRDLETGLSFNVQRRAGSAHADVQPLTAQDTKIFKEIYGGSWSWRRRAIIVERDGYQIAASMHGMPHGQGAISGNNFSGHFCIHFLDSTTHSNNIDLAHQLMVWKAAGLIEEYLKKQSPQAMIEIALTALGQNDRQLLILSSTTNGDFSNLYAYMSKIVGLKINSIEGREETNTYIVEVQWYEQGTGCNIKKELRVNVIKDENRYWVVSKDLLEISQKIE